MNWKDKIDKHHKGQTGFFKEIENKQKHEEMRTIKLNPTQQEAINEKVAYLRRNNLKSKAERLEAENLEAITELMNEKIEYWKYNLWLIEQEVKSVWCKEECRRKIKLYSENI